MSVTVSTADIVAAVQRDGYAIVEDAFPTELADEVRADLDRLESELGVVPSDNDFEGLRTLRIYNLLARGALYEQIPLLPSVLPIVEGVLDAGCLISSLSSIVICPGEKAQPIHSDDILIPLPKPHPPLVCNTMWAITDFTEENGATRLVPGSHLKPSPTYGGDYPTIPAEMRKGSVLVWDGALWHSGGANRSPQARRTLLLNYTRGWLRTQYNQFLSVPREMVLALPAELQKDLGYARSLRALGECDGQEPLAYLRAIQRGGDGVQPCLGPESAPGG